MRFFSASTLIGALGTLAQQVLGGVNALVVTSRGFAYGSSFVSAAALVANTPQNVVAAAANVNGLIVWQARIWAYGAGAAYISSSLLCKATAPATPSDGVILARITQSSGGVGGADNNYGALDQPVFVPAGLRLDFIDSGGSSVAQRSVLYTVL